MVLQEMSQQPRSQKSPLSPTLKAIPVLKVAMDAKTRDTAVPDEAVGDNGSLLESTTQSPCCLATKATRVDFRPESTNADASNSTGFASRAKKAAHLQENGERKRKGPSEDQPPLNSEQKKSAPKRVKVPKLHICPTCRLSFQTRHDLKRHSLSHTVVNDIFCKYRDCVRAEKGFPRMDNYRRHLCSVHNES